MAVRLDPNYEDAYSGLGDAYLNAGKWDEALVAYKEQIRVAPNDAEAFYNLGYAYNKMGRHGEAFTPLVKAINLDPQFSEAHYGIGFAYLRGQQYDKAVGFLKSAIRLKPDYAEAYLGLGVTYTHLGNFDAAQEQRQKLAALDARLARQLDQEIEKARAESAREVTAIDDNAAAARRVDTLAPRSTPPSRQSSDRSASKTEVQRETSTSPHSSEDTHQSSSTGKSVIDSASRATAPATDATRNVSPPVDAGNILPPSAPPPRANMSAAPVDTATERLRSAFGLKPGTSTREDVSRTLGPPIREVSATMSEYKQQAGTGKIYVEYNASSGVAERIEAYLTTPVVRAELVTNLQLPKLPQTARPDSKGRIVEYFGAPKFLALMHVSDNSSGVNRVGFFSAALFQEAVVTETSPASTTDTGANQNPSAQGEISGLPPSVAGNNPPSGNASQPPSAGNRASEPANAPPTEQHWSIPANTVLILRMLTAVNSKTAKPNDQITAVVSMPVTAEGQTVLPAGTLVEGKVTQAKPAGRMGKPGMLAVDFGELVFKNGSRMKLIGTLTAANVDPKKKIDPEGEIKAKGDKTKNPAVFIGGGAALGAVVGGLSGGGQGAGVGAVAGAGIGIAAAMLVKGPEAEIKPGFPFGIQLSKALVVKESNLGEAKR